MLNVLRVSLRYIRFKCVKMFHRSTAGGFCDAEKSSHNSGNGNDDVVHISEWKDKATNAFVLLCKQTETRNTINVFVPLCCALITRNHQFLWSKWASFKHFTAIQYFGSAWNLSNEQEKKTSRSFWIKPKNLCAFSLLLTNDFLRLYLNRKCALWIEREISKATFFFFRTNFIGRTFPFENIIRLNAGRFRLPSITYLLHDMGRYLAIQKLVIKCKRQKIKKKLLKGPNKKFQLKWWKPNSKSRWPNDSYFLPMHFIARPFFNR